jgi:hypothetical protein
MKSGLSSVLMVLASLILNGQGNNNARLYGYVEPYFCYDLNQPEGHTRPGHIYSYNRHNEVSLNLGMIGVAVADSAYRGNFALMSGSYANANMSNERRLLQHIFEANAGIRLRRKNNVWLDAGVLPSHIGFESAIGGNCATLSRSILADNTPYFETGVKLSWLSGNERWAFGLFALNGWQRIEQRSGSSMLSAGTQITFSPNEKLLLNSSTFIGTDDPDISRRYRFFHNFYAVWKVTGKLQITSGFDIGLQQIEKNSVQYSAWHSAVLISRYKFSKSVSAAVRGEYYYDPTNVIVNPSGIDFSVFSYSVNFDYQINDHAMWRIEFRSFHSSEEIYSRHGISTVSDYAICSSICVSI